MGENGKGVFKLLNLAFRSSNCTVAIVGTYSDESSLISVSRCAEGFTIQSLQFTPFLT